MRICERNSADKFSGEREEVLQPAEQISLQPMEVHSGAEIHLQPLKGDGIRAGGCLEEAMALWEVRTSLSGPMEGGAHAGAGLVTKLGTL